MPFEKLKNEYFSLIDMLRDDSQEAVLNASRSDTQYNRRIVVRNFFAYVEVSVFSTKKLISPLLYNSKSKNIIAEYSLLHEEQYDLDNKGNTFAKKKYLSIENNVLFTFRMYAGLVGGEFNNDLGSKEWQIFKKSIKIRNRITHPKSKKDFEISDTDTKIVGEAAIWFIRTYNNLVRRS